MDFYILGNSEKFPYRSTYGVTPTSYIKRVTGGSGQPARFLRPADQECRTESAQSAGQEVSNHQVDSRIVQSSILYDQSNDRVLHVFLVRSDFRGSFQ